MLEKLVGAAVSGRTEYEVASRRVTWRLVAPLDAMVRHATSPDVAADARSA